MGSIVEAALYDIVGKFFLLFVIVPAGVIFLGYVILSLIHIYINFQADFSIHLADLEPIVVDVYKRQPFPSCHSKTSP